MSLVIEDNTIVSIVVPHYNSEDKISRLLDSIGNNGDIEVIIVDDKSDEKNFCRLQGIVKDYSNIRIIHNNTDEKGAGVCRNIGIDNAKGRWILFADADDWFDRNYYSTISCYLDSEYDLVFFPPTSYCEYGEIKDRHKEYSAYVYNFINKPDTSTEYSLRYKFEPVWSKLIRTSIIKENSIYCDNTIVANDVSFSMKLGYYARRICCDRASIYCYAYSDNSLTTNINIEREKIRVDVFVQKYVFLRTKLDKHDFKNLNLNGMVFGIKLLKCHMGFNYAKYVLKQFTSNRVPLLDKRLLDLRFLLKKIIER